MSLLFIGQASCDFFDEPSPDFKRFATKKAGSAETGPISTLIDPYFADQGAFTDIVRGT